MLRSAPAPAVVRKTLRGLVEWPERSQQTARRNALVAATALAERRREQQDVEEFLAHLARRSGVHGDLRSLGEPREERIG